MKFGRSYYMTVTGKSGAKIAIGFPTTLELNISHNIFSASNVADFSLYNLSAGHRSEISFNQFLKPQPYPITLHAGYISQQGGLNSSPKSLPIVFKGYANIAYTERNGSDLITRINAFDNGDIASDLPPIYFNQANSYTADIGTSFEDMVGAVMKRLIPNGVQPGKIFIDKSQIPPKLTARRIFNGRVWTELEKLASEIGKGAGGKVYIENGVCNMLGQKDTLPATSLGTLESSTGLLGIPKYTGATIICSSIFEPALSIGATINLKSSSITAQGSTGPNGPCKIVAYTHHGVISGVESGQLISDITLMQISTPLGAAS